MPDALTPLIEQQELLKSVVTDMVRAAGHGWDRLELLALALGLYSEIELTASTPDGSRQRLRLPMSATEALLRMRTVMAATETGAWFTARVLVDESLACTSDFDYEREPEWEGQPGLSEYRMEQREFPRSEEHQPDWLKAGLAAAGGVRRIVPGT